MRVPLRPLVLSFCSMHCVERGDDGEGGGTDAASTTDVGSTTDVEGGTDGSSSTGGTGSTTEAAPPDELDPDECDEPWARNYCTTDEGDDGVQFCRGTTWGLCASAIACWPGDFKECRPFVDYDDYNCELDDEGLPEWVPAGNGCFTPLVLRFEGERLELTAADGYAFDISGTGECLSSDWPSAATPWLALDRDSDGTIADARELFGSGVVLRTGEHAQNGFAALAEHDFDGDGRITPRDPVWLDLLVWSDHDGDRRSTPWELEPAAARGLTAIDLDVRVDRRCDTRGNCEVEHGLFTWLRADGRPVTGAVVDVHLACQ